MSNFKDPFVEGVFTMNKGMGFEYLLFKVNVSGTPAAGVCTGVKFCEKFSPILIVGVGVIKVGQVKVN